jgi:hypothetical protein
MPEEGFLISGYFLRDFWEVQTFLKSEKVKDFRKEIAIDSMKAMLTI